LANLLCAAELNERAPPRFLSASSGTHAIFHVHGDVRFKFGRKLMMIAP
jgi:hypothetical protein